MNRTVVADVMSRRIVATAETTPFKTVLAAMRNNHVNALPVLNDAGTVVGVVSAADLLLKEVPSAADSPALPTPRRRREHRKAVAATAVELMTAPAHTVAPHRTVAEAAELMRAHQVNQLPVVDEATGQLVGIVTRSDLLRVFTRSDGDIHRELLHEVVPGVPGVTAERLRATVDRGMVTLRGVVRDRETGRALVRAVEEIEGVVHVANHLVTADDDRFPSAPLNW